MATLRPLFKDLRVPGFANKVFNPRQNRTSDYAARYNLDYVGPQSGSNKVSAVYSGNLKETHASQESIIDHNGIQRRVEVDVIFEA